jgi:hypothetical protein
MQTTTFHGRGKCVLVLLALVTLLFGGTRRAHAQVAEDAFIRAWMDTTFYTGSPGDGPTTTVLAPVLQADLKVLGLLRIGLDLPFAAGWVSASGPAGLFSVDGSQFTLGTPTVHGQVEIEAGPLFARAGLGVALSVRNNDVNSADDFAGFTGLALGAATRGMWNAWWFLDRHTVFAPGEVAYRGDNTAFGVEGALIAFFPRSDSPDTVDTATALQIGAYIAGVSDKTSMFGLRFRNLIAFSNDVMGSDKLQSSLELFAETHLMKILLLGGGFLLNLDEPFGVFGSNGADIWALRVKAGIAL